MTWASPMTAVSGGQLTATQFNRYVRDNLNETAPAKLTQRGYYIVPGGTNTLNVRHLVSSYDTDEFSVSPGSEPGWVTGDGSSTGPSVSCITGTSALVMIAAKIANEGDDAASGVGFAVTGSTNIPIELSMDGTCSVIVDGIDPDTGSNNGIRLSAQFLQTGLNPGTNIFTMYYRQHSVGTCWYAFREIIVLPL